MKKCIPALLALTLFFAACDKEDDPAPPSDTYQPTTAGSTWTYHVDNKKNAAASFNFTLTSQSKDSSMFGKSYRVFSNSSGSNEYYFQSGTDYYQVASLTGLDQDLELLYLKDQAKGTSWSETKSIEMPGIGTIPTTFSYSIEDKLATYTVGSATYNDVLKVKVTLAPTGITINSQKLEFYYAPNIGRIQTVMQLKVMLAGVDISTETNLTSSTIK